MCTDVFPACIPVHHMWRLMPTEAKRGYQTPWNWSGNLRFKFRTSIRILQASSTDGDHRGTGSQYLQGSITQYPARTVQANAINPLRACACACGCVCTCVRVHVQLFCHCELNSVTWMRRKFPSVILWTSSRYFSLKKNKIIKTPTCNNNHSIKRVILLCPTITPGEKKVQIQNKAFRDLGGERLSGLTGRELRWNALQWGEGTCTVHLHLKDRGSSGGMGLPLHSQKPWARIVPVWKNYRNKTGEEPEEKEVQWQAQIKIQLRGRPQGLILLRMLSCAYGQESSVTALQKTQQASERIRCRYLHPTNEEKLMTPVTELGKS